jgi:hypothetical protein
VSKTKTKAVSEVKRPSALSHIKGEVVAVQAIHVTAPGTIAIFVLIPRTWSAWGQNSRTADQVPTDAVDPKAVARR